MRGPAPVAAFWILSPAQRQSKGVSDAQEIRTARAGVRDAIHVRTPDAAEVSANGAYASETRRWVGRASYTCRSAAQVRVAGERRRDGAEFARKTFALDEFAIAVATTVTRDFWLALGLRMKQS